MTDHQRIVQEIIPAKLKEIEARENIRVIPAPKIVHLFPLHTTRTYSLDNDHGDG